MYDRFLDDLPLHDRLICQEILRNSEKKILLDQRKRSKYLRAKAEYERKEKEAARIEQRIRYGIY